MSVNLDARNFTQPGIYANDAQTIIPVTPNPGIAYRDPNVTKPVWQQGQPFDSIVDSRIWNQLLYIASAFSREGELFAFFRWSPLTDYVSGSHVTATNGIMYVALKDSGPTNGIGPRNPMDYPDYWQTLKAFLDAQGQQTSGGLIPIGMIDLLPFRYNALPFGWYFCNGERFADTTTIGQALQGLPASLRLDWNIVTTGGGTNVPLMLDASGRGYFIRSVNGTSRQPGSIEQDASRQITATANSSTQIANTIVGTITGLGTPAHTEEVITASGVFSATQTSSTTMGDGVAPQMQEIFRIDMNLYGVSATTTTTVNINQQNIDVENRPTNIGMTPAIYLGV